MLSTIRKRNSQTHVLINNNQLTAAPGIQTMYRKTNDRPSFAVSSLSPGLGTFYGKTCDLDSYMRRLCPNFHSGSFSPAAFEPSVSRTHLQYRSYDALCQRYKTDVDVKKQATKIEDIPKGSDDGSLCVSKDPEDADWILVPESLAE